MLKNRRFRAFLGAILVVATLGLSACADPIVQEMRGSITGNVVQFTDTGVDRAGGPRVKSVNVFTPDGKTLLAQSSGTGNGTAQGIAESLLPAAAHATGYAVAASVVRAATTKISNNTSSFGYGEGGQGGTAISAGNSTSNTALGFGGNASSNAGASAGASAFGGGATVINSPRGNGGGKG